ncbi:phosphatidic acid phosphatase type 2/haloperoxidase [Umbelopsis sp. PMI_123]|nr:phosphatidic acid phosphatase type 2/haloperoxidase [Umbelopsis sp. PMI_123]
MPLEGTREYLGSHRRIILSYLKDWILGLVFLIIFLAIDFVPPFHQEFYLDDWSIRYPYSVKERVSFTALLLISILAPLVIIVLIAGLIRRSFHDVHHGLLGLFFALTFTLMFTDVLKITIGEPRPDMLARCQPSNTTSPPESLLSIAICNGVANIDLQDGFKSFPSGHSSYSFAGLGYLSLYLCGKLHVFDHQGHVWKGFIVMIPIMGAILVAISRIMDYRHHPWDVIFGSLLGFAAAYFSYHQYYPRLSTKDCHMPFEPRHHVKLIPEEAVDSTANTESAAQNHRSVTE